MEGACAAKNSASFINAEFSVPRAPPPAVGGSPLPEGALYVQYATIEGDIKESELAVLRKGVVVDGVRMPTAKVKYMGYDGTFAKVSVVIDEGQNHQVRRMFDAIGTTIKLLKRVRIGQVHLGGLYRGKTKPMTQDEIDFFKGAK